MSYIYIAPLPENKLDRHGRVNGHIYYKLDREGEGYLDGIAKRFDGVSAVYAADIAAKPAQYLAKKLGCAPWITMKLRGFNFGKFNGRSWEEVGKIVNEAAKRWEKNPTVPVAGGDSWTSYDRRYLAEMFKIVGTVGSVGLVILVPHLDFGVFLAAAKKQDRPWTLLGAHDARYKVVKVKVKDVVNNDAEKAGDVPGSTEGSSVGSPDVGVPDSDAGVSEAVVSEPDAALSASDK